MTSIFTIVHLGLLLNSTIGKFTWCINYHMQLHSHSQQYNRSQHIVNIFVVAYLQLNRTDNKKTIEIDEYELLVYILYSSRVQHLAAVCKRANFTITIQIIALGLN